MIHRRRGETGRLGRVDGFGLELILVDREDEEAIGRRCLGSVSLIGENRERRAQWRREHPELVFYER